jgi:hypothetical protein
MITNYKIVPKTKEEIYYNESERIKKEIDYFVLYVLVFSCIVSVLFILFSSWTTYGALVLLILLSFIFISYTEAKDLATKKIKKEQEDLYNFNLNTIKETDKLSKKLNLILEKSDLLVNDVIPNQKSHLETILSLLKYNFKDNALIPFWDNIESFIKNINSLNESITILDRNKQFYFKIIEETSNNFPKYFPNINKYKEIENLIKKFKNIKYEAFRKFEFASIWEQRKTQKIIALGFLTMKDAIDNMPYELLYSIRKLNSTIENTMNSLSYDIKSLEFNNYTQLIKTNSIIEKNLQSIDDKLK